MDYSIVTLPRVGSNYLQDRILQHTGIFVERFHTLQDNKMITIARDPVDFLTSEVSMRYFYDSSNLDKIVNDGLRSIWLEGYAKYFTGIDDMAIVDKFDIIIDYDRLINFPVETVQTIANIMDVEIINEEYKSSLKDYTEHSHLISSKKVKEYNMIKEYVQNTDLSKLYDIYHTMLDKSIY
jgi:hypothetical protein